MTRDTLKIIHAFFPTAVQALVGVFWNTPTVPMWLPMLSTLPTVTLKNKQANKKPNVTLNSPLFCVKPFHCEPILCPTTSESIKSRLLSMWRAPWQPGPSSFLSPITLWSLSGSPEDVTFSGFPSPPNSMLFQPPVLSIFSFFKPYVYCHFSFLLF